MATPHSNEVETASRVQVWWLKFFKKYVIRRVLKTPQISTFGKIYYKHIWVLAPEEAAGGKKSK